jgi:hypothetical protein
MGTVTKDFSTRRTPRSFWVPMALPRSLADRSVALFAPWHFRQYPGKRRALAELLGVGIASAKAYLQGRAQLPWYHAERLATYHEQCAARHGEVARLLRAYAPKRREEVSRLRGRALMLARHAAREEDRPA